MPAKIESKLVLVNWLSKQFGFVDNQDMLSNLKNCSEEWGGEIHPVLSIILARDNNYNEDKLRNYNDNIYNYLIQINQYRDVPITLKYFQYLSALMTELLLDKIANEKASLVNILNNFVNSTPDLKGAGLGYTEIPDLNKLAIWGATGCGKTLLMHINYYQFMHYKNSLFTPDNIILITPNESLSDQHIKEMEASGIPCSRAVENTITEYPDTIKVIEITKLTDEKKGKGVSIATEMFQGNNLLFVDEGHKGSGGESWFSIRRNLAQGGFTFEYSATFGQALDIAGKDALDKDYFKHIAFDYSYYYFYGDGYGKDFDVINLAVKDDRSYALLLGNLMSICEQAIIYKRENQKVQEYELEKPLLLLLGNTVTSSISISDIIFIIQFLSHVVSDRDGNNKKWVEKGIDEILTGKNMLDEHGEDVFQDKFSYLRKVFNSKSKEIYKKMLELIFHAKSPTGLRMFRVGRLRDQVGLKVGDAGKYFGVIYVGETNTLQKKIIEANIGLDILKDPLESPLFESINSSQSDVNILIGARKFIEGWNSWRVSGMGLLNVGSSKGTQIIQLFGRGVRLKGKNLSLKRSTYNDEQSISIKPLERLNIFGINASYVQKFHEMLQNEGVDNKEIILPIRKSLGINNAKLYAPKFPAEDDFKKNHHVNIKSDNNLQVSLRISTTIKSASSDKSQLKHSLARVSQDGQQIVDEFISHIDIEDIRLRLLEDKFQSNRYNLFLQDKKQIERILKENCSFIDETGEVLNIHSFSGRKHLQDLAYQAIKKYANACYRRGQKNWETHNLDYEIIDDDHNNLSLEYKLHIPKSENKMIDTIEDMIENNSDALYEGDVGLPKRVYLENHLYQPLLLRNEKGGVISPSPLMDSEHRFIVLLREYIDQLNNTSKREIFVLRNLSRGKGIGFYEDSGFFPDFIVWVKENNTQKIIFVEPHGLMLSNDDYKHQMYKLIQRISENMKKKNKKWKNISMDCYVLSKTTFKELIKLKAYRGRKKSEFENENILFLEDNIDCIQKILG